MQLKRLSNETTNRRKGEKNTDVFNQKSNTPGNWRAITNFGVVLNDLFEKRPPFTFKRSTERDTSWCIKFVHSYK